MCQHRSLVSHKHASVNLWFSLRIAQQDSAAKYSSVDLISSAVTPVDLSAPQWAEHGMDYWCHLGIMHSVWGVRPNCMNDPNVSWYAFFNAMHFQSDRTYRRRARTTRQGPGPSERGCGPFWSDSSAKCESPPTWTIQDKSRNKYR